LKLSYLDNLVLIILFSGVFVFFKMVKMCCDRILQVVLQDLVELKILY